jgi:hypothetical protein
VFTDVYSLGVILTAPAFSNLRNHCSPAEPGNRFDDWQCLRNSGSARFLRRARHPAVDRAN